MDRSSRRRISKIEQGLSAAQKERAERRDKLGQEYFFQALHHATAVAAIVLSGQPKIDEPLIRAWERALRHYGINVKEPGRMEDQVEAARRLIPIIAGYDAQKQSARFTEIFRTAPVWLLQFTRMYRDACVVKFQLPDFLSGTFKWGTAGYESSWPQLPLGMMTDGDPVPDKVARLWPLGLSVIHRWGPIPDLRTNPPQEANGKPSPEDLLSPEDLENVADFILFLDLAERPEVEWSRPERRRMRKFLARLKGQ